MSRLLIPLTIEIAEPQLRLALELHRKRKTSGDTSGFLLNWLLCINERNKIYRSERHLLNVIDRIAVDRVLEKAVSDFEQADWLRGKILREYYIEEKSDNEISAMVNYARPTVNRLRKECLPDFFGLLLQSELRARRDAKNRLRLSLPAAPYRQFVGREDAAQTLVDSLTAPSQPMPICLYGTGGIGKTSLAHHVIRQFIPHLEVDGVAWITIQSNQDEGSSRSPKSSFNSFVRSLVDQLTHPEVRGYNTQQAIDFIQVHLHEIPHLVVIDNLEALGDQVYILNHIQALLGKSRFLLTSRIQPTVGFAQAVHLSPLAAAPARQMFDQHALRNIASTSNVDGAETDTTRLLERAQGHPLALRLLASTLSQTGSAIPAENDQPRADGDLDEFFDQVYFEKWLRLNDDARMLLLAIPLLPTDGATDSQLEETSGLSNRKFWPGLEQLIKHSLVNQKPSEKGAVVYSSHSLTQLFALRLVNSSRIEQEPDYNIADVFQTLVHRTLTQWFSKVEAGLLLRDFSQQEEQIHKAIRIGLGHNETCLLAAQLMRKLHFLIVDHLSADLWCPLFEKALQQDVLHDAEMRANLLRLAGWIYQHTDNKVRTAELLNEAAHMAEDVLRDEFLIMQSDYTMAWLKFSQHHLDDAKMRAQRSLKARQKLKLGHAAELPVLHLLSIIARVQGNTDAALDYLEQSLSYAIETNNLVSQTMQHLELLMVHGMLGSVELAETQRDAALDCIKRSGHIGVSVKVYMDMARVYNDVNQPELAQQELSLAESTAQKRPMTTFERCFVDLQWARFHMARDEWMRAHTILINQLNTWHVLNQPLHEGEAMLCLAIAMRRIQQPIDAKRLQQQAVNILSAQPTVSRAQRLLSTESGHALLK